MISPYIFVALILLSMLGAIASYNFKKSTSVDTIPSIFKSKYIYTGTILYLIAAVGTIVVLNYADYSAVLPFSSFTYIWTMILAKILLGEIITKRKIAGVGLIVLGAILIALP